MKHLRLLVWLGLILPFVVLAAVPDVAVRDIVGNPRNVNEFIGKGKWVVVAVWSADCPICRREIHHMTFFHDEHHRRDAEVLGLSIDGYENKEKVRGFIEEHALNFPNVIGTPDDASLLSGMLFIGTPTYYLFAPNGRLAAQRIGPTTQEDVERLIATVRSKRPG